MSTPHQSVKVRWSRVLNIGLMLVPSLWLGLFTLVPLLLIGAMSFAKQGAYGTFEWGFTWVHFRRLADPLYQSLCWKSLALAIGNGTLCLVLGYPLALIMATARPLPQRLLLILTVLPFLTNFILRIQSIKWLLSIGGPVSQWLVASHMWTDPQSLQGSPWAVVFGLIVNYLPSMVLPLYVALRAFDFDLIDAAKDLGARRFYTTLHVLWPLTAKGMAAGWLLVFVPTLGEFLIPDMLGGGRSILLGGVITVQFTKWRNWPFGAALSMILIVAAGASILLSEWLNTAAKTAGSLADKEVT